MTHETHEPDGNHQDFQREVCRQLQDRLRPQHPCTQAVSLIRSVKVVLSEILLGLQADKVHDLVVASVRDHLSPSVYLHVALGHLGSPRINFLVHLEAGLEWWIHATYMPLEKCYQRGSYMRHCYR